MQKQRELDAANLALVQRIASVKPYYPKESFESHTLSVFKQMEHRSACAVTCLAPGFAIKDAYPSMQTRATNDTEPPPPLLVARPFSPTPLLVARPFSPTPFYASQLCTLPLPYTNAHPTPKNAAASLPTKSSPSNYPLCSLPPPTR
jgi:hypothetical protein